MRPVVARLSARLGPRAAPARSYATSLGGSRPIPRHLMSMADLTHKELTQLVLNAARHKETAKRLGISGLPKELSTMLTGQTVALMFNKRSTRTRVSTEAAVAMMGGHSMFLGKDDIQLGVNETVQDTAQVISRMVSSMVVRTSDHAGIQELAANSKVPVINALSDSFHPLQAVADILTIHEAFPVPKIGRPGLVPRGLKVAWVGDANNVLHDLAIACIKLGIDISVAAPNGYQLLPDMQAFIRRQGEEVRRKGSSPGQLACTHDPLVAVKHADFIVTDTWISMGQEEEKQKRLKAFEGFQVTEAMARAGKAGSAWRFMHCLPRHPEEVDDAVFYGPRSLVFDEAENRVWAAVAVLESFIGKKGNIMDTPLRKDWQSSTTLRKDWQSSAT
ncbi:putative ornithine carbamoyl transferase [Xylariaceae sp. FL0804]|nr:putative ornithine carbamoyl transferase [Xylariaceae sp. FL0804]